jgi:cation transport regulator ChaC
MNAYTFKGRKLERKKQHITPSNKHNHIVKCMLIFISSGRLVQGAQSEDLKSNIVVVLCEYGKSGQNAVYVSQYTVHTDNILQC